MTYNELTAALGVLAQQVVSPATDYLTYIPTAIQSAELRALRDLGDLMAARGQAYGLSFTAGSSLLLLDAMPLNAVQPVVFQGAPLAYTNPVTIDGLDLLVPFTPGPTQGWMSLMQTSLNFIQNIFSSVTATQAPVFGSSYYALLDDRSLVIAPTPDQSYQARITGTWRPAAMSAANQSSYLGTVYPDLLLASAQIEMAGYAQNYGSQADNPQQAISWTTIYQQRLGSARAEERRRQGLPPPPPAMPAQAGA